jgi:biopolymer transport protein ExbD
MAGVTQSGANANINVVPLIDIVLVLLIIFMVVTPMLSKGVDVKLPPAVNAESKDERTSKDLVITVKSDKSLYLDTQAVSKDELTTALGSVLGSNPFQPIMVKGDERVAYKDVRDVVLLCQKAGAKTVNMATEAKKK